MTTSKLLQADANYFNKRLTQKNITRKNSTQKIRRNAFAYSGAQHANILPYNKEALSNQYLMVKELVAGYVDKKQITLFDKAITLLDKAHLARMQ